MVRSHGQAMVTSSCTDPLLLLQYQGPHYGEHIHIPLQVIGLMEVPTGIPLGTAKVDEVDPVPQPFHHSGQVIPRKHPIGPGTETTTIVFSIHGGNELPRICLGTH